MDYKGKTKKRKLGTAENSPLASAIGGEYEVFLSFTGKDTLNSFTGILYNDLVDAGIRTFRDDDELRVGEEIGPELMEAIKESKICIPIFSQNYASSKWGLLELAQIVECKRSTGQKILPIFYDVEPSDVRHQTGSYEEAFREHEKHFDKETVQRWKEALKVVGGLKGWDLKKDTNGHHAKLVKIVVEEVLSLLKKNYMVVTDNLVGIDHHIEEMKRLLNVDSNDVRIVGIYGMGGLGKTTIAKFVYNELSKCFDRCCFLADVREKAQQDNGLVNLQKQLISMIQKGKSRDIANVHEGINMIKGMACKKKVLIVLDDVDDESQFDKLVGKHNWFGSGSRIIVTTRNKGVLNVLEVDETYEPNPMEPDHALQLFSRHAFRSDFPPEDRDDLSRKIVSTTGGLPLALEIIGSFLFGKCEEVWEETLLKLKVIPDDLVKKQLRISYDALNYEEKRIFLDIACFFIGENKTLPFYMWNDCRYYPTSGINILVLRSLVKIGDDNEFIMHDQLRDLGREIVRQENIGDPGQRSRLWIYEEALDILKRQTGTKEVEALCLQTYGIGWKSGEHSFTNDEFGKLPNLRFLRVDCTDLNGDFKNLFSKLRWLQWRMCTDNSKPINFHLKNLVILDLSRSLITENWEGWHQIKMAKKLKVLDLSFCRDLTITPDLSNLVMLKELHLYGCHRLVEVRGLTGLKSLENLDMMLCTSLERLPDLSNLVTLKELHLYGCHKLVEVRGLTGLKSLENLDMKLCTSLERLPNLSNLVMLKSLNLFGCDKLVEVTGLTGLKSLENMKWCISLERLPDLSNDVGIVGIYGMGGLGKTTIAKFVDRHIKEMKRLLNVDSNDVRIVGIYGMGGLGKTTIAKFVYNELSVCFDCCCFLADVREMSQQYSGLVNLQKQLISKIQKGKSPDIASVDEGINMIKGMACQKKVLIVLDDVDNESQFTKLVGECNQFGSGSRIIVTTRNKGVLNVLEVDETYEPNPMEPDHALQLFSRHAFRSDFPPEDRDDLSRKIVSTTGRLPLALEIIGSFLFGKCEEVWEETLLKLKVIPDDLVQKQLRISYDALNFEEKQLFLDIACFFIGENKTSPFYMWNDCKYYPTRGINTLVLRSLVKIGDDNKFSMHDQLRDLGREIVRQESTVDPEKRSRLWIYEEALDILKRQTGTKEVEALCLQTYGIGWKSGEHSFTNDEFGKLPNLRFLRVDCTDLTGDFKNLLSKLRWLQWRMCTDNSKPINFHLKNLVILDLSHSLITENWEGWSQIKMAKKLKVLDLSFCRDFTKTPDLSNLVMLKELHLHGCHKLVEVRGLTSLKSLENLDMMLCTSLERLPDLSNLVMLKSLNLFGCNKLVEVIGLTGSKSLENLDLVCCTSLERLPDLSNLVMLKRLNLSECDKLVEVRGLTGLKSLERLNLSGCNFFEGLLDLSNLKNLKDLVIHGLKNLTEIRGLEEMKSLTLLDISGGGAIEKGVSFAARMWATTKGKRFG